MKCDECQQVMNELVGDIRRLHPLYRGLSSSNDAQITQFFADLEAPRARAWKLILCIGMIQFVAQFSCEQICGMIEVLLEVLYTISNIAFPARMIICSIFARDGELSGLISHRPQRQLVDIAMLCGRRCAGDGRNWAFHVMASRYNMMEPSTRGWELLVSPCFIGE